MSVLCQEQNVKVRMVIRDQAVVEIDTDACVLFAEKNGGLRVMGYADKLFMERILTAVVGFLSGENEIE